MTAALAIIAILIGAKFFFDLIGAALGPKRPIIQRRRDDDRDPPSTT